MNQTSTLQTMERSRYSEKAARKCSMTIASAFKSFLIPLALLLCLAATAFARSEIEGKVVNVADGDTITVLMPDFEQVKVRLYGIDCPEKKQAFGQKATQFTAQRVAGENVRVQIMDTDRYGRSVGVVYTENGTNLNRELLTNGLAWVYDYFCKEPFCDNWKQEETRARRAHTGLWVDKNPIEPWEWRKMRKRRN